MIRILLKKLKLVKPHHPNFPQTNVSDSVRFEIGDRVKMADKVIENFNGSHKEYVSKMVYQVVDIDVCIIQGVMLKLHCGTTLLAEEAVKVDVDTPLRT